MSLKEKLIYEYIDYDLKRHKLTPLRLFVRSIGLDHNKMTNKDLYKWANSKRYKDFASLYKIKKIADEANIKESVILSNYKLFVDNFDIDLTEENIITESEVISFIKILEMVSTFIPPRPKIQSSVKTPSVKPPKVLRYTKHQKRGKYKSLAKRILSQKKLGATTLGSGGLVSGTEGQIIFSGTKGKHSKRTLGAGRLLIKKKVRTPTGMKYRRKVYRKPQQ